MAKGVRLVLALVLAASAVLGFASARSADAQAQTIKIGLLYDHTGPFSAAGSLNCWRGAKMMIDLINEKGGVLGKYKIVQVDGDSQSKTEAAINEAERLLNVEKVDILAGVYSSAHAVPLAEKVDKQKKFLWITTAISDAVVKDRNLEYTFRPQTNYGTESQFDFATSNFISTDQFGSFFNTFSFAGDANFVATFAVPEPAAASLALGGLAIALSRRRRLYR